MKLLLQERISSYTYLLRCWTLRLSLMLCLISGGVNIAFAQTKSFNLTGRVIDEAKQPLAGATIVVKGSSTGQVCNSKGAFTIAVNAGDILQVRMLGYVSQDVKITSSSSNLVVTLAEDARSIQSVVVEIGYGATTKKDLTGTVGIVSMDDLVKAPVPSFDQALQGRIAGVQISSSDGQPGSDIDVVIRGANSLTQSNAPLYVVDGFPLEDFSSSSLNTLDIASMTVLKDASATAIYGSRGANGVIIIETKKGKEGAAVIAYNGTFGVQNATKKIEMMTPYDYVNYQIERNINNFDKYLTDEGKTLNSYRHMPVIDWQERMFRSAPMQMHNVSVSGGNRQTRYVVSGSAVDQKGVILNSGYQKYQGRISIDQKLGKHGRLNANVNYTEEKVHGQTASAALSSSNAHTTYLMYRTWGSRPFRFNGVNDDIYEDINDNGDPLLLNPVTAALNESKVKKTNTLIANVKLDRDFGKHFKLTIRGGINRKLMYDELFNNSKTYGGYPATYNSRGINGSYQSNIRQDWVNENTLVYDRRIAKSHKINALIGMTLQGSKYTTYGFANEQVPNENLGMSGLDDGIPYSTTAKLSENSLMSFLARLNYDYKSRYYLTVSMRADGSSKFAPENRWGYFPSGAVAWRISNEPFMQNIKFISNAKLRASYGVTGNNRVGDYASYPSLSLSDYYSMSGGLPVGVVNLGSIGNRDLTWETTAQTDIGLDLSLFKERVNLTVDVYRKTTKDLLLNANIPYSSGYDRIYKNIGKVRNEGLEISVSTVNINKGKFRWTSDFNISFNRDKVMALTEGEENLMSKVDFTYTFNSTYLYIAQLNQPMASFYGMQWDGVYQYEDFDRVGSKFVLKNGVPTNGADRATIRPGDIKYVDQNGDFVVNDQDMVVIGRCTPIHTGGFNNAFSYGNLELSVFFQWSYGNDIMNANRIMFDGNAANQNINQYKSYVNRWSTENTSSKNFRVGGSGPNGIYSSRTIEDGSFIRLKTLQLSYSIPKKYIRKIRLNDLKISVSGQNLFTWSNYSGLDPEVSVRNSALTPGYDYSAYARNRICTIGLQCAF